MHRVGSIRSVNSQTSATVRRSPSQYTGERGIRRTSHVGDDEIDHHLTIARTRSRGQPPMTTHQNPYDGSNPFPPTDTTNDSSAKRSSSVTSPPNAYVNQNIPLTTLPAYNTYHGQGDLNRSASLGGGGDIHSLRSRQSSQRPSLPHGFEDQERDAEKALLAREGDSDPFDEGHLPDIQEVVEDLDGLSESDQEYMEGVAENPSSGSNDPILKPRKRRRAKAIAKRKRGIPSRAVKKLRLVYVNFLSKSLLTRSFVYWLPLALVLFIPLAVGAWGKPEATLGHAKLMWLFIWLEIVWGSLWIVRIVSHYLPHIVDFILGIINPQWRKYSSVLGALEMALTYVLWAFVSFITFWPLLSDNHQALDKVNTKREWQSVLNNILVSLLIASLVYFAERLFIHLLGVSFHKTRFQGRITRNKASVKAISVLLRASYDVFPPFCEEFAAEDALLSGGTIVRRAQKVGNGHLSALNLSKVVGNIQKVVGGAANAVGNVARDIGGGPQNNTLAATKRIVIDAMADSELVEALAVRIWKSLVPEEAESLTVEDLIDVMCTASYGQYANEQAATDQARNIFTVLDADKNGDLSLDETVNAFHEIADERGYILRSLKDMDSAIQKLHSVLLFFVLIIVIIIFIGMLSPSVGAVLATLGSSLLALSFIFSATCQEILASCVFLFVKHPIDVGDSVVIATPQGLTQMTVVEMSLLYTVFQDIGSSALRQAPNAQLNTLWIDNYSRSGTMNTGYNLICGMPETTPEAIDELRRRVTKFTQDNPRDFMPGPYIQVTDFGDLDRIQVTVNVGYRQNFSDLGNLGIRRTMLIRFLGQCINEIPLHVPRRTDTMGNPNIPLYTRPAPALDDPSATRIFQEQQQQFMQRKPFGFSSAYSDVPNTAIGGTSNSTSSAVSYSSSEGARHRSNKDR